MHRTQIYIDDDIFSKVKNISKSLNISVSEFIRKSIKNELNKDSKNDMESFFDSFDALDSFKNTDASKYTEDIRSKSRILNG